MNGKCHRALRWEAERGSDNSQVTFQFDLASPLPARGQVAERLNAPVLKTGKGASPSWVRIPPCPPAIGSADPQRDRDPTAVSPGADANP